MPTVEHMSAVEIILGTILFGIMTYALGRWQSRAEVAAARRELAGIITMHETLKNTSADRDARLLIAEGELKTALQANGSLQNTASLITEFRETLRQKEDNIQSLSSQLSAANIEKVEAQKDAQAAEERAKQTVEQEKASQKKILEAKDEQLAKLNDFISQARETLSNQFKALSAESLKDASEQLSKTTDNIIEKHAQKTTAGVELHQQQIATMLKPVEETMKRLDSHVESSNRQRATAETLLKEQVERLAGASESLTNALKKPVIRGSWGEMTLENVLESAGLEVGVDFELQHSTDGEDGLKRTDAIINLPKGKKLIIDSKNLMETYIAFSNAEDESEKAVFAENHARSLRNHVRALSTKEYWRRYDGLDCVILFIPHDGMYHAAIKDEAELIREACDKRVFVTNTMSLIPLLKAVQYVLNQERLNKNAESISSVATELYSDLTRLVEKMAKVGERLKGTVAAYNDSMPAIDKYIVAKSRKLKSLGSARGADPELPELIDANPRLFTAPEFKHLNPPDEDLESFLVT